MVLIESWQSALSSLREKQPDVTFVSAHLGGDQAVDHPVRLQIYVRDDAFLRRDACSAEIAVAIKGEVQATRDGSMVIDAATPVRKERTRFAKVVLHQCFSVSVAANVGRRFNADGPTNDLRLGTTETDRDVTARGARVLASGVG